jgi:hypothetical protein
MGTSFVQNNRTKVLASRLLQTLVIVATPRQKQTMGLRPFLFAATLRT